MGDETKSVSPISPEQALFAEALQINDPRRRTAYLDAACGANSALRQRLGALLRAADNAGDFLEEPPTGLGAEISDSSPARELSDDAGARIDRYKLLEKIGEGGCGIVYMAEQEEPVRRRVALKIIKLGMDTRAVVARFEAERQALAMMDHPNIAKVLDGGATTAGRPYFVMELVRGVRITDFCDEGRLSTEARLLLFVQVCRAVQHAHQKGIIHRDLKPSNILVTVNDGAPVPKVIDFGIAKATGEPLTAKTLFTQFHSFIGTPAYMSPEQTDITSVDIDTRADIYALGVLLYELLTGRTPFDGEELVRSGLDEMRRIIRETDPPRPSTRLTSLLAADARRGAKKSALGNPKSEAGSPPSFRSSPTKELISAVRGDLDWIVMKCLDKDRARRYGTANDLAEDIQRHMNREPVAARPQSQMYLLSKLTQRNRGALLAVAIILIALMLAVITLATSNSRIRREHNLKDQALREKGAALETARASEQRARDQLLVSLQNQAQARRNSRQIGQRLESLAALAEAARLRPTPELRDNAIAAMAIPDVEMGPILRGWNPDAYAFAFDSLNMRYARVGTEGISIRTVADDRELQMLELPAASTGVLFTFSPDGRFFGHLDKGRQLRVWRCENGEALLKNLSGRCFIFAFSPDSKRIAIAQDGWIFCLDPESGKEIRRWPSRDGLCSMDFGLDGRFLAVGYKGLDPVSIYDVDGDQPEARLPVSESSNTIVSWHPGGDLLAVSGPDPRIQIWNVKTRRKVSVLEGHGQTVIFLAFYQGGDLLLSISWDGTLRLWEPSPGRALMRRALSGWIGSNSDSQWTGVVANSNDQARLWRIVPSQERFTFLNTFGDDEGISNEGDISPDGRLLALAGSDGVRLWDLAAGREVGFLPMSNTEAAAFRANGRELLTCGSTDGLLRWPIRTTETGGALQVGPPHRTALPLLPTRMAKAKNDQLLAVIGEKSGRSALFDLVSESVQGLEMEHTDGTFIALSSDGERMASSGWHSDRVKIWNAQTGQLLKDLHAGLTARVFFTPDSREIIISRPKEFTFHDLKTFEVSRRLPREAGLHPGHVAFTTDGKMMALEIAPGFIHLKEVSSERTVATLEDPYGDVSTWMSFTPDGAQLIVAARYAGAIHRWDLRAIRKRLKTMNLDWDWPEFPDVASTPATAAKNQRPLRMEILGAKLATQRDASHASSSNP